ncbi:hypothetical protein DFH29DRAFT_910173 [Suillus ampliporus]|nr:hypothetical protein DFH29DRAFT_910173 [Suillus ampliporus]
MRIRTTRQKLRSSWPFAPLALLAGSPFTIFAFFSPPSALRFWFTSFGVTDFSTFQGFFVPLTLPLLTCTSGTCSSESISLELESSSNLSTDAILKFDHTIPAVTICISEFACLYR